MSEGKSKRNYIRRKKYLNDTINQIKATLEFLMLAKGETPNRNELTKLATAHAQAIEAACWSPHSRLTAEDYQTLMSAKTRELCIALTKKAVQSFDFTHLSHIIKLPEFKPPERAATPQVSVKPQPMIPRSAPVSVQMLDDIPELNEAYDMDISFVQTDTIGIDFTNIDASYKNFDELIDDNYLKVHSPVNSDPIF